MAKFPQHEIATEVMGDGCSLSSNRLPGGVKMCCEDEDGIN